MARESAALRGRCAERSGVDRARLLTDIDEITELRSSRFFRATVAPPAFLYIAVLGFLCTMGMLGVHEATLRSLMLMGFYCAFVGIVIYFILSLTHPFEGIARVTPEAFEMLRDSARAAEMARPAIALMLGSFVEAAFVGVRRLGRSERPSRIHERSSPSTPWVGPLALLHLEDRARSRRGRAQAGRSVCR